MSTLTKSLVVALIHILIVLSLGGKLLYDRQTRPRVWVRTRSVDPDLPIRGRYMALRLQVQAPWFQVKQNYGWNSVTLAVDNGTLVANKSETSTGISLSFWGNRPNQPNQQAPSELFLDQGVLFFLPEHAEFPRLNAGEELWAEVTIPRKGPPRPIQLALKHGGGVEASNVPVIRSVRLRTNQLGHAGDVPGHRIHLRNRHAWIRGSRGFNGGDADEAVALRHAVTINRGCGCHG